jgi:hypothetical protein
MRKDEALVFILAIFIGRQAAWRKRLAGTA